MGCQYENRAVPVAAHPAIGPETGIDKARYTRY